MLAAVYGGIGSGLGGLLGGLLMGQGGPQLLFTVTACVVLLGELSGTAIEWGLRASSRGGASIAKGLPAVDTVLLSVNR
jgi:hypothetical protein